MKENLKDILSIFLQKLTRKRCCFYLNGKLSEQQKHEVEKKQLLKDEFSGRCNGRLAGIQRPWTASVHGGDAEPWPEKRKLKRKGNAGKKKKKKKKNQFKDQPWIYVSVLIIILLIIISYIVVRKMLLKAMISILFSLPNSPTPEKFLCLRMRVMNERNFLLLLAHWSHYK